MQLNKHHWMNNVVPMGALMQTMLVLEYKDK